jgi:5-hydroxyisourate hydrolase
MEMAMCGHERTIVRNGAPYRTQQAGIPEMRIVTQVLDSTYGQAATGVHARLERASGNDWRAVAEAETNRKGCIEDWDSSRHVERGLYRIVFDSDSYFAGLGANSAYPEVVVIFRVPDESHALQVRVTLSPYTYTTYCGVMSNQADNSE